MNKDTARIKIKCETEGFDEATEQIEALVRAYDEFPPQVQIKWCRNCTINIHPSQTKFYEQAERNKE